MSARLRHLETMESLGQVGPGGVAHWSNATPLDAAVQELIPAGGVGAVLNVLYVSECIGVGIRAGMADGAPGGTFDVYNAGGHTLTVTVAAGGQATIARSAGVQTFAVSLLMLWL